MCHSTKVHIHFQVQYHIHGSLSFVVFPSRQKGLKFRCQLLNTERDRFQATCFRTVIFSLTTEEVLAAFCLVFNVL